MHDKVRIFDTKLLTFDEYDTFGREWLIEQFINTVNTQSLLTAKEFIIPKLDLAGGFEKISDDTWAVILNKNDDKEQKLFNQACKKNQALVKCFWLDHIETLDVYYWI